MIGQENRPAADDPTKSFRVGIDSPPVGLLRQSRAKLTWLTSSSSKEDAALPEFSLQRTVKVVRPAQKG
jgi:hypothetical protein